MNILISLAILIPCLLVALGCWLGYQILLQNGRLLLRLEAVEAEIQRFASTPPPDAAPPRPAGLPVESLAPDFRLPDRTGRPTDLSIFQGRRVLLIFFNIHCGFCLRMAPALKSMTSEESGRRPVVVIIATGDPAENVEFFRTNGIECPILFQKEMEVASLFGAQGTPMGYLIDEQGRIASELAAGETALLALVGVSAPQDSGAVPARYAPQNGTGNGRHHPVGIGNKSIADSQINRSGLTAGTTAPSFWLPRVGPDDSALAETLSLESFRGQRLLLIFSDPNCGPCRELAVKLEQQWRENASAQILMISRGDPAVNGEKIAEQQLTFPVVLQRQWEISKLYGMFATSIAFLIDEHGVIIRDVAVGVDPFLQLFAGAETAAVQLTPA
ncbi:MAG TPA: redoxin domain-containing protein [Armatimonadota bacterium]|nr:redoxin domain-containing protein [Armatimonadota bacterium]